MRKQHDEALKANEELRRHVDETVSTMQGSLSDVQSTIAQLTLKIAKLATDEKVQLEEDPSVIGGEQQTPDPAGKVGGSVMGSGFGIPAQLSTQMHQFNPKGIEQRTPDLGVWGVGFVLGLGTANQTQFTSTLNQFTPNDPPGNSGDQMNMEDSMAEDPVRASTPTVPVFGQPLLSPSPAGFMFGSTAPSPSPSHSPFQFVGQQNPATPQNPSLFPLLSPSRAGFMFGSTAPSPSPSPSTFQFGGQQNPATPQNPSLFQASNNLDFSAGGGFLLGSGGGDKSPGKMVLVSRCKKQKSEEVSPSTFQFGGQQNPATPQNPSPFQASNNLDFSAGGSFTLGSGGGDKQSRPWARATRQSRTWARATTDKSARKMCRVSRCRNRKK